MAYSREVTIAKEGELRRARLDKGLSLMAVSRMDPEMRCEGVWKAARGYPVLNDTAKRLADRLGRPVSELFEIVSREDAERRVGLIDDERRTAAEKRGGRA